MHITFATLSHCINATVIIDEVTEPTSIRVCHQIKE